VDDEQYWFRRIAAEKAPCSRQSTKSADWWGQMLAAGDVSASTRGDRPGECQHRGHTPARQRKEPSEPALMLSRATDTFIAIITVVADSALAEFRRG